MPKIYAKKTMDEFHQRNVQQEADKAQLVFGPIDGYKVRIKVNEGRLIEYRYNVLDAVTNLGREDTFIRTKDKREFGIILVPSLNSASERVSIADAYKSAVIDAVSGTPYSISCHFGKNGYLRARSLTDKMSRNCDLNRETAYIHIYTGEWKSPGWLVSNLLVFDETGKARSYADVPSTSKAPRSNDRLTRRLHALESLESYQGYVDRGKWSYHLTTLRPNGKEEQYMQFALQDNHELFQYWLLCMLGI